MGNPSIWVATKLEGKFLVSEIILRPDKLLMIVGGILISDMKEGSAQLGEFLGLAGNPERLKDVLDVSPGDEVLIIPTSEPRQVTERREMEDMRKWPNGVYPGNEECPHCHSRNTSVTIHGAIRQWWCQSCGQPFMPKELDKRSKKDDR